ncbi:MAG: hypothetical protein QOI50_4741, partial [Pseudonocardiales bacterium]|nr:hypothetical protein [Pseudonocardiales bacterium]
MVESTLAESAKLGAVGVVLHPR